MNADFPNLGRLCAGGGRMKKPSLGPAAGHLGIWLLAPSPDLAAFLAERHSADRGSLHRAGRRALASCAVSGGSRFDGRLRREPDVQQFLRPAKDKNPCGVDKTS